MQIQPKTETPDNKSKPTFDALIKRVVLATQGKNEKKPDRTATDNEVWPPIDGTTVEAPSNGQIRYERDGQGVVVEAAVNPQLFKFLTQLNELNQAPGQKAQVEKAIEDGNVVADRNSQAPAWGDVKQFEWQGNLEDAEVVTYTTQEGDKVSVSKALTPELFETVKAMGLSRFTLESRAKDSGREVAGADTYVADHDISTFGWPDEFGNGVIQFDTKDGKHYVVSQFDNKELYDRVADKRSDYDKGDIQDLRDKHNLGDLDALDILSKPTGEKTDDGEDLSVVELATKNLMDKYKKLVDDGKVGKDSDIYKLVKAIEAKATLESGHTITPYIEDPRGAESWRMFDDEGEDLTNSDMQDILDGDAIDKTLTELFTNGDGENAKIGKEYQDALDDAIGKVSGGDKDALAQDLHDKLVSRDFTDYLNDLEANGMQAEGQTEVARLLSSLEMLNPDLAKDAQNELKKNSIQAEVDQLMADPSAIPEEYKELALKDIFQAIKSGVKGIADLPRRTQDTLEKFINELMNDKEKMGDFSNQLDRLNRGEITQEQFEESMANKYVGMEDKDGFKKALGTLNKYGVLGSISGFASLGGAIYMLSAKNGQLSDDPLERLAIAKDFITFLGTGAQFEKTKVFDLFTKTNTADLLGLSKSLPEIWGKEGLWGKKIEDGQASNHVPDMDEGFQDRLNSAYELSEITAGNGSGSVVDQLNLINEVNDGGTWSNDQTRALLDDIITRSGGQPPANYDDFRGLNQLADEQGITINEQTVTDAINAQRAQNGLPALDAEVVEDVAQDVSNAASRAPSVASSGATTYYDAVSSLYESAVEYFTARDIPPPTREAFNAGIEDRLSRDGQAIPDDDARYSGIAELFDDGGLDRDSINVMFEKDGRTPPASEVIDGLAGNLDEAINTPLPGRDGSSLFDASSIASDVESAASGAGVPKPGIGAKVAGSVVKVLGVAPDVMSIADIVMGGIAIKDGMKSGSGLAIANGSLQIVSGVAGTVAGGIGIAGLMGSIGALAGATAPLFFVTAALGFITGIIGVFVDHQKKQKATDKEGQWFKDLADLGLAQDDWGDKLEYARYSFYQYEGRDGPTDQSIFDYQDQEWEHFQQTPQDQGSSVNRLDEGLHKDDNGIQGYNTNGLAMDQYGKPFYEAHKEVIDYIHERWDDWNGKDKIVSDKDLRKIASGDGSQQEKDAAQFLLDNKGFFDMLDVFWKRDGADGKLSTDDLEAYLKLVGAMEIGKDDPVFYEPEKNQGPRFVK
ncbi:hypothetical protein [Pseudomonas sp. NPDC007930]|uniref:hypothetical protein n=1 Tax=Pseudomonas sp. NPDC007930 TaxID=3364417 RepID=UPI0036E1F8FD